MALQIRRTEVAAPAPPTGLKPGQLSIELRAQPHPLLYVGVPATVDPLEYRIINPGDADQLPVAARVRVVGGYKALGTQFANIVLELDRPAPANCFVQFWRFSRRRYPCSTNVSGSQVLSRGFRPLGFNDGNRGYFPVVVVPANSQRVTAGTVPQLFLPTKIRNTAGYRPSPPFPFSSLGTYSRYDREMQGGYQQHDIKVLLKFGITQRYRKMPENLWIERRSLPSIETIKIERWRYEGNWGFKVTSS